MNSAEEKLIEVLSSLPLFAEYFLKIRAKSGKLISLHFNRAQRHLHELLEKQKKETGKVRAIILKGRQLGCSSYIQVRFFHQILTTKGKKAFILTHQADATRNLFSMTNRFYDSLPIGFAPLPDVSSAKELNFKSLNSGYSVGTAGNKAVGRSQTIQLMHGSEVGFWENADEHAKGILQAVPTTKGTEIILESTANGIGNYFYNIWQAASSGQNDFQAIFLPWYWQEEYIEALPSEYALTDEEQELLDKHHQNGLTVNHLIWRRKKMSEFSADFETAKQRWDVEYPMTALDAFKNPQKNIFIGPHLINKARKTTIEVSDSPLVIGVDPAISNKDRTAIIRRKGRLVYNLETHYNLNTMELVGLLKVMIDRERPSKVAIDCIGIGAGIVDRLLEMGYSQVEGVNVARSANQKDKFKNLRAELWHDMREWLANEMDVQIPDSDELAGDLMSVGYKYDSNGRLQIESKDDLRARGMKSCDCADALAISFCVGNYFSTTSYQPTRMPDKAAGMFT